jgi:hypothetical protein
MKRVIVNGHGWSGSSAFIELLKNQSNPDYILVPGEFDDFRVPGTLRELLESDKLPKSHRKRSHKSILKFFIRSLVSDDIWKQLFGNDNVSKEFASLVFKINKIEKHEFQKCLKRALDKKLPAGDNLQIWFNSIVENIWKIKPTAKCVFFEQFFLFDDNPSLYDWLDFDKLILFIRPPSKQLNATLESEVLYNHYPWQAEFLIGGLGSRIERKYKVFLDTTRERYSWIIEFLKSLDPTHVCIVNFDSFLYKNDEVMATISDFLNLDLRLNTSGFSLSDSISRDQKWNQDIKNLQKDINETEKLYADFELELSRKYLVV